MCYALPGPRCSTHERQKMEVAEKEYKRAEADVDDKQEVWAKSRSESDKLAYENAVETAKVKEKELKVAWDGLVAAHSKAVTAKITWSEAVEDWRRTPEGIADLRSKGFNKKADAYEADRERAIADFHAHDAARLAASSTRDLQAAMTHWNSHRDKATRKTVAKTTPFPEIQNKALGAANVNVRYYLAQNPHLIPEVRARLALDASQVVRSNVAKHTSDRKLLSKMAADENYDVRAAVASNPATSPRTLSALSTVLDNGKSLQGLTQPEYSDMVRVAVAANHSTPASVLSRMADQSPRRTVEGKEDEARRYSLESHITSNPNVTPAILRKLDASNPNGSRGVINNSKCPVDILAKHAKSEDVEIQRFVASRWHAPENIIRELSKEPNPSVRLLAVGMQGRKGWISADEAERLQELIHNEISYD